MEKQWRSLEEYKNGRKPEPERLHEEKHKNAVLDVLDNKLADPLMHMLRNAVDHGIDDAVRAVQVGGPAGGGALQQ